MRFILLIATLITLSTAATVFTKKAPLYGDGNGAKDGDYIVVFQKNAADSLVTQHLKAVAELRKQVTVRRQFHIGSFRAYSVQMEDDALEAVRMMPEVRYVERNGIVHATVMKKMACETQDNPTWGLARICKRPAYSPGDDYDYESDANGSDVDLYVIDTGIRTTHVDFGGRATGGVDCITSIDCPENSGDSLDPNGHGTHVASTAGGTTYGIAKKANLIPVRVLNAGGSGTYEQVIAGVDWVAKERSDKGRKSVANMSLGGGANQALNDAVNAAADAGVHMIVAAGNELTDACNRSPAGANGVTSVGATDIDDQMAYFSNYGECVEIFAPGVNVVAAYGTSDTAIQTLSGTSMASPHVAGIVADILSRCTTEVSPGRMEDYIKEIATKDSVSGLPPGHTDHDDLAYKDCDTQCPDSLH